VELLEAARDPPPVLDVEDLIVLAMAWPPWVCAIGSRLREATTPLSVAKGASQCDAQM
jgi:hypothetical protein